MPLLIDLILRIVLASFLGGCSYLVWLERSKKISEKRPRAISEFTVLFSLTFVVSCFLGSWFHLKTLKRKDGFRALVYSAVVNIDE